MARFLVWGAIAACLLCAGLGGLHLARDSTKTTGAGEVSAAPVLSREEQLLKDCADIKGADLWIEDRDGDGLMPALAINNFQPNYLCVVSGAPQGFIHVTSANQIGLDAYDWDKNVHFAQ